MVSLRHLQNSWVYSAVAYRHEHQLRRCTCGGLGWVRREHAFFCIICFFPSTTTTTTTFFFDPSPVLIPPISGIIHIFYAISEAFCQGWKHQKRGLWVGLPRKVYVTTCLKRHRKMMIFLRHLFLRFESARKGKCFHCLTRPVPTPHPQQKKGGRCHQCFQTGAAICDP